MTERKTERQDIYEIVTEQLLSDLEKGVRPWANKFWAQTGDSMPRRANGERYRGINILLLWAAAAAGGYTRNTWMTYKQAQALGGNVRKGEKSTQVSFFSVAKKKGDKPARETDTERRQFAFAKAFRVFNVEQIDGLSDSAETTNGVLGDGQPSIPQEEFFDGVGATIAHGGETAWYRPAVDLVHMPPRESFVNGDTYAAILAHELVHWTGHKSRCARKFSMQKLDYAREELVAEIGAAFVCGALGIAANLREDHAAYVEHYVQVLRNDKRAIVRAASAAQKAADYLFEQSARSQALAA